jgi:hypothetical protein
MYTSPTGRFFEEMVKIMPGYKMVPIFAVAEALEHVD